MAFKFNFTVDDLDLDETDDQQQQHLETSLNDLSLKEDLNKFPCKEYDILTSPLPAVIQADILNIPNVSIPIYKRTLADVKFQMAEQDTLEQQRQQQSSDEDQKVLDMLNLTGNSDLVRGVYEGGFKTWECSIDLVQWLAGLPDEAIQDKQVLEIGCGSALPSLYLLARHKHNRVDVQDYNDQVIRLITLPNILLNTILSPQEPTTNDDLTLSSDEEEAKEDDTNEDDDDDEEKDQVMEDPVTCDAEAEIPADKVSDMLQQLQQRTKAFVGDWEGLSAQLTTRYDILITSETIYAEHSLPDLIRVFQKALVKPQGVA
ncbi:hypothetical protein BC941DRAFT_344731 [Chlamydoabsidia padenii]|nr:hypothetical protein BC941DRAFT_344731 [Chlamydoabsidia padenii]